MKYGGDKKPMVCMLTQSSCYKGTYQFAPKGVLWHCTGCNNPNLWRYVQPSNNDPNREALLSKIGKNNYGSDWNHVAVSAGVNAWIGKLADGSVTTIQALPWNYAPWGCAGGPKGSANNTHIQFEICEDALTDKTYFEKCYKEAVELTAYLCKLYNIDPKGTTKVGLATTPTIICHHDAYNLGVGSGHYDVYNWFNRYGRTMDDVRNDVAALLAGGSVTPTPEPAPAPQVPTDGATDGQIYRIRKSWSDPKSQIGAFKSLDNAKKACMEGYTVYDKDGKVVYSKIPSTDYDGTNSITETYLVRVTITDLNIRSGPGVENKINGVITPGVYTIVETKGVWGRLKSGAGWINLGYANRV